MSKKVTKKNETKKTLRERISLRLIMTSANLVSILGASLLAGYFALEIIYENKLNDTWAIMFLELEQEGNALASRLNKFIKTAKANRDLPAIVSFTDLDQANVIQGGIAPGLSLKDFGIDNKDTAKTLPTISVISHSGEFFHSTPIPKEKHKFILQKLPSYLFKVSSTGFSEKSSVFLITRQGKLLYTTDSSVSETNYIQRKLVQKFITSPIQQGQLEFEDDLGVEKYGFFYEIPESNIIFFSEVEKSFALQAIRDIVIRYFLILIMILVVTLLIIQLPLSRLIQPVQELANFAQKVGQGSFAIGLNKKGYGEVSTLSSAFSNMATGLIERDKQVAKLMKEQIEKVRLEGELAVAKQIQENLLPRMDLPSVAKLRIAAEYIPASECAGDWYHFGFRELADESIIVISDVSGHGAGSSMFTAVLAGLFDDAYNRNSSTFDLNDFATKCNDAIYRLGRQQWHATMIVARHRRKDEELDILCAGHPQPFLRKEDQGRIHLLPMLLPASTVLGLSLDFLPSQQTIKFDAGNSLLMFTDGLIEARNPEGKMFSKRRVRDKFAEAMGHPINILEAITDSWKSHIREEPPADDVCIVVLSAAA